MTRTIQVDEKTLKSLMTLKKELKARSYQEVITVLVSQKRGLPSSLFGLAKGSKPFQREPENEHALWFVIDSSQALGENSFINEQSQLGRFLRP